MGKELTKRFLRILLLTGLMVVVGCGGLEPPVSPKSIERGKRSMHMKASNFEFKPNNIKVTEPGSLTLVIDNISGTEHNITIKNPEGQKLKSVDLPPKETTIVSVDLPVSGNYGFYCEKDLHSTLGMKGQIEVGP